MESISLLDGWRVSGAAMAMAPTVSSGPSMIIPPRTELALFTRQLPPGKVNI